MRLPFLTFVAGLMLGVLIGGVICGGFTCRPFFWTDWGYYDCLEKVIATLQSEFPEYDNQDQKPYRTLFKLKTTYIVVVDVRGVKTVRVMP